MGLATKVFSDSGVSGVRVVVVMMKGILIIPLITNLLGADSYGVWTTVLAFVGLLASSGAIHLHGSLVRFSASEENGQTYSDILLFGFLLATGMLVAIITIGQSVDIAFLFDDWDFNQVGLVFGSSILIFSNILLQINLNFPRSRGMVKLYEILRIARTVVETVVLVVIFILGGSVITGIFGLASAGIILNLIFVSTIVFLFDLPRPRVTNFSKYVRYGAPMIPAAVSNRLMSNADKYLILYLLSPTAVGIYAVAHSICASLSTFSTILNPTLYPTVSEAWEKGNSDELRELYTLVFRYYSIVAIPAFFGLSYLAYEAMTVLSTSEIAVEGTVLVPVLAFGFLLRGFDNPLEYILTSTKKTSLVAKATFISATGNVVLNLILISYFDITGAAIATTVSHCLAFGLLYTFSIRELSFEVPFSSFVRATLAAIVMLTVFVLIPFTPSPVISLLLYPPLGVGIYFAILYFIGEFEPAEIDYFADEIARR